MKKNINDEKILGIAFGNETKKDILEKIKKNISSPTQFFHIVSVNPENIMHAKDNEVFKDIIATAQIRINDGVGTVLAARFLGFGHKERVTGVDLMKTLLLTAQQMRLRVLLIGGEANLAEDLAKCYSRTYPEATFWGIQGVRNIKKPEKKEMEYVRSIVTTRKPHMIFVAFGSPSQEMWLWEHRHIFTRQVCMGVGGAFDYEFGLIGRAPKYVRDIGLEWLYRLIRQPERLKRQLKLPHFMYLVLLQRLGLYNRAS